jgi:hypothetical protein
MSQADEDTITFAIDVDTSVLNQGHEYERRMGPNMGLQTHIEMAGPAQQLVQSWHVPTEQVAFHINRLATWEKDALHQDSVRCNFCGTFIDSIDPGNHLHEGHFQQHRAFRRMRSTFDILCSMLCVCDGIVKHSTVLTRDEITNVKALEAQLPADSPVVVALRNETQSLVVGAAEHFRSVNHLLHMFSVNGAPIVRFFETSQIPELVEQVQKDQVKTRFRPFAFPWETMDLFFENTAKELLRNLQGAREFRIRCVLDLQTAVDHQRFGKPPALLHPSAAPPDQAILEQSGKNTEQPSCNRPVVPSSSARLAFLRQQVAQSVQSVHFQKDDHMDEAALQLVHNVELQLQELREEYIKVETAGHDTGDTARFLVDMKEQMKPALKAMRTVNAKVSGVEALIEAGDEAPSVTSADDDCMRRGHQAAAEAEPKDAVAQIDQAQWPADGEKAALQFESANTASTLSLQRRSSKTVQSMNTFGALMASSSDEEDSDDEGFEQVVAKESASRERKREKAKEKGDSC